jgi:hypothetical protein
MSKLLNDGVDRANSLSLLSEAMESLLTFNRPTSPMKSATHKGIVTVKSERLESMQSVPDIQDADLQALRELPRFEPLITTTVKQSGGFFSSTTHQDVIPCTLGCESVNGEANERKMFSIQNQSRTWWDEFTPM